VVCDVTAFGSLVKLRISVDLPLPDSP